MTAEEWRAAWDAIVQRLGTEGPSDTLRLEVRELARSKPKDCRVPHNVVDVGRKVGIIGDKPYDVAGYIDDSGKVVSDEAKPVEPTT